jgi:general nucleoside transport system permease protein
MSFFLESTFWIALLAAAIRIGTPLLLASLGETVGERAGLLNAGVEGMMILGAISGFYGVYVSGEPLIGFSSGIAAGALIGLLFGLITVLRGADQVATGIVLNIFALAAAAYFYQRLFASANQVPQLTSMAAYRVPYLSTLPFLGRALFTQKPVVYFTFLLVPIFWLALDHTRWGLNVKAVGENPEAVDSAGVNVWTIRLQAATIGGAMAGLAGATIAIDQVGAYVDGMIAGRGFIVLAIVVFGGWRPWRVAAACVLFGAADALQLRLQISGIGLPNQLLVALPYVFTIVVVAIVAHRGGYPSAINRPYLRRHRVESVAHERKESAATAAKLVERGEVS